MSKSMSVAIVSGHTRTNGAPDRGRASFRRFAWKDIYAELSAADRVTPLEPKALERLAMAAFLLGRDAECAGASTAT
jgi:hypothetical protein